MNSREAQLLSIKEAKATGGLPSWYLSYNVGGSPTECQQNIEKMVSCNLVDIADARRVWRECERDKT